MFENAYLYRIDWRKPYLGIILCYLAIFNFSYIYNRSTLQSEMYDDFSVVRNYGKLPAKFFLGTSTVIENVGLLSYFLFFVRTTIRIRLNL